MRIIKKGKINKDKFIVFVCERCGCEFSATPDEYMEIEPNKYVSCCPDCHKINTATVEKKEEAE